MSQQLLFKDLYLQPWFQKFADFDLEMKRPVVLPEKVVKPRFEPYTVSERVVLCGAFLEHYSYKTPYIKGMPKLVSRFPSVQTPQTSMLEQNVKRTRTKIRRLVNSNSDLTKFFTLTFSEEKFGNKDITNIDFCNRLFDVFVKRMRRAFPNFKYLCVPEYQGDFYFRTGEKKEFGGAVHYHLLCNLPYVDTNILQDRYWGNGHVKIKSIKDIDNVGAYVCKYLGKENFDSRFFHKKKFFYSRNLVMPLIVDKFSEVKKLLSFFDFKSMFKRFSCTIDTKYFGVIQYNQYKINIDSNCSFLKVACT